MRVAAPPPARARSREISLPAAVSGIVESRPSVKPAPASAVVLENWIPTQRGCRIRGGLDRVATIGEAVTSIFDYNASSTKALFAASAGAVYNITALNESTVPAAAIRGMSAGYYGAQMMGTSGGEFLNIANGTDYIWYYDGTDWNPIADVAINDVGYDALSTDFSVGETVTGGTSGATATVLGITTTSATAGTLKVGTITGGPFQDNESLTSAGGAATANGASTSASSVTITGVATTALSAPWLFANRLFYVEKGTQSAWYLPADSIGGAAAELSFAGVFQRGGALLFGGTWSLDSGDGLDDKCVFVSDQGEVAIYEGLDPDTSWALRGRYDITTPQGINGVMQAGGDFLIATEDGIVPLSEVVTKDPAALSLSAVTRNVEDIWAYEVERNTGSIELVKWSANNLGVVILPSGDRVLLVNLETGAWSVATGWEPDCATVYNDRCFGGWPDGYIRALDETGSDDGTAFTARYCQSFDGFGNLTQYKQPRMMQVAFFAPSSFTFSSGVSFDYLAEFAAAPVPASLSASTDYLVWDSGNWDEKLWYSSELDRQSAGFLGGWRKVIGGGYTVAPTVQVTSNSTSKLNIELVQINLIYETGGSIV